MELLNVLGAQEVILEGRGRGREFAVEMRLMDSCVFPKFRCLRRFFQCRVLILSLGLYARPGPCESIIRISRIDWVPV